MTLFVLVDRYFFSWAVFEDNRDLEEKINQYTRTALERKAVEMRDMIGNVAHDLKTPLSSFMTATEMIRNEIELYQQALQRTSSKDLSDPSSTPMSSSGRKLVSEVFENILSSINSVRDIHLFMLMMINRCIDFKKASNGIELVPVKETIDLPSVIDMPVQCMKNIQHKIKVKVHDFPPELHPYIKTDRQWLQENLLCVLSNAVKHSTGGTVELLVSLTQASSFKKKASKVVEEVVAKNNAMGFGPHRRDSTTHSRNQSSSRSSASSPLNSNERKKPVKNTPSEESTFRRLTNMMAPSSGFTPPREKSDNREEEITGHPRLPDIEQGRTNNVELFRTITESSEISEGEDRLLLFEIKDCGVGLSQYELTTFFNPFKQKRLSGGTGLGLYSLAKRVEALGGQFGVHPREDGLSGSVIWFAFPYIPDKTHVLVRQRSSAPWQKIENSEKTIFLQTSRNSSSSNLTSAAPTLFVKKNTPPALKFLRGANLDRKLCVLVVEDAPTIAKMTCMMLRKQNIETEIAENGQIALDMIVRSFGERKYDAILMDYQMPVMDGIEATKRIRELEEDRRKHKLSGTEVLSFEDEKDDEDADTNIPIIGISAMSDAEVIEEGLKAGMNVFIPKPFSSKDFKTFIEKIQMQR
eukprot:CAMPEP_0173142420 /NCGR_PEP_ID=MMETSP1105-20130129/6076_1 /TAXON_ID=2985 /ORGANISM="Ochromonas sp., Strain BG-1" /LENGTH=638 /DNA_ID=CAMNT_0014055805 /DNA_START=276 /DNA_END=2192 /DNA_ORIENTATION=-